MRQPTPRQKYGILGELTTGDKLVKANGLMESSTIAAILLGSVAGGVLADWHVLAALGICALMYGGAVIANLFIPKLAVARPGQSWRFGPMTGNFFNACRVLWRNGETRFSLMGTSMFWGPALRCVSCWCCGCRWRWALLTTPRRLI